MALLSNEAFKAAVKYLKENSVPPTKPKQHKKRSNQSENYHNRVQKKWDKRHVPSYVCVKGANHG